MIASRGTQGHAEIVGERLKSLRERIGLTQGAMAVRTGMHQSALSRLEQQDDALMSTIIGYVGALGAGIRVSAHFLDEVIDLCSFQPPATVAISSDLNDGDQSSRDVVFSIKPQYSERIFEGSKTVELRRRFPSKIAPGTLAFIYTTTPVRAITGIAEIEDVMRHSPTKIWRDFASEACISRSDFRAYFAGVSTAVAIKLRRATRLHRPLGLAELRERFSFEPPQSFLYAQPHLRKALQHERVDLPHRH